jgi:hypothetical protein
MPKGGAGRREKEERERMQRRERTNRERNQLVVCIEDV